MAKNQFPVTYINDTHYSLVEQRHDWIIEYADTNSFTKLNLVNKTSTEAKKQAEYFGIPVEKPWWKFWSTGMLSVTIMKSYPAQSL